MRISAGRKAVAKTDDRAIAEPRPAGIYGWRRQSKGASQAGATRHRDAICGRLETSGPRPLTAHRTGRREATISRISPGSQEPAWPAGLPGRPAVEARRPFACGCQRVAQSKRRHERMRRKRDQRSPLRAEARGNADPAPAPRSVGWSVVSSGIAGRVGGGEGSGTGINLTRPVTPASPAAACGRGPIAERARKRADGRPPPWPFPQFPA